MRSVHLDARQNQSRNEIKCGDFWKYFFNQRIINRQARYSFRATSCTLRFMISCVACILMHDQTTHGTLFISFGHSWFRATSCTLRFTKITIWKWTFPSERIFCQHSGLKYKSCGRIYCTPLKGRARKALETVIILIKKGSVEWVKTHEHLPYDVIVGNYIFSTVLMPSKSNPCFSVLSVNNASFKRLSFTCWSSWFKIGQFS